MSDEFEASTPIVVAESIGGEAAVESSMRAIGTVLCVVGLLVCLFAGFISAAPMACVPTIFTDCEKPPAILLTIAWIAASVAGLGAFMWMLGNLEIRLIEIRNAISGSASRNAK